MVVELIFNRDLVKVNENRFNKLQYRLDMPGSKIIMGSICLGPQAFYRAPNSSRLAVDLHQPICVN